VTDLNDRELGHVGGKHIFQYYVILYCMIIGPFPSIEFKLRSVQSLGYTVDDDQVSGELLL